MAGNISEEDFLDAFLRLLEKEDAEQFDETIENLMKCGRERRLDCHRENGQLRNQIVTLQEDFATSQKTLLQQDELREDLKSKNTEGEKAIEELKSELASADFFNATLQDEMSNLHAQINELRSSKTSTAQTTIAPACTIAPAPAGLLISEIIETVPATDRPAVVAHRQTDNAELSVVSALSEVIRVTIS